MSLSLSVVAFALAVALEERCERRDEYNAFARGARATASSSLASVKEGVDSAERARKPRTRRKAGSSADAQALVAAAESAGACLQVGLVERFNPVTAALDRLGDPPVYVEVHRLAPFHGRASDVGVVMPFAPLKYPVYFSSVASSFYI